MGGQCSGEYIHGEMFKKLTVITLSYCGLTSSPFEFYINEYEHQLQRIGDYFQQLILPKKKEGVVRKQEVKEEQGLPDFLDKDKIRKMFGNIELKFKKRYSPMFDKMAGIIKNERGDNNSKQYRFVTQKQFQKKWDQKFKNQYQRDSSLKKQMDKQQPHLQTRKANVRKYDFLMFQALLRYVYKKEKFEDVVNQNPQNYINIISPLFEFSFLDETSKLSKFQYGFRKTNPDVYFLQQTTNELVEFLEKRAKRNYRWIGDDEGQLIIVKNQTFLGEEFRVIDVDKEFNLQPPKVQSNERITKPIALGTVSKRFLFVSLHFSSRDKPNQKQIEYLTTQLLVKMKQSKIYECVILGGNLNGFQEKFPEGYNFYPKLPTEITTFKKRTKTQAQIAKNDIRDKRSLDKIITNREMLECEITLIDGTKPDLCSDEELRKQNDKSKQLIEQKYKCGEGLNSKIKMMLPCEIHPFDKFLVKTTIQVPNYKHNVSLSEVEVK